MAVGRSSRLTKVFSRVSRRTRTHWFFSRSLGPSSRRRGTPFISHWLNFQPGALSLSSSLTRAYWLMEAATSAAFSATPGLWGAMGTTTTCQGAMAGGRIRPSSSPWVMMMAPTRRVETPQLVWKG